jgi:integrase/recombinase XerD
MTLLAPTLQAFFSDRLMGQRGASSHTIAAYRDSIRLLLRYAADRTHKQPCQLDIADLDAPLVATFLEYVERDRHNSVRTRNNRLAAIHSLFRYTALRHPEHAASIQRVLAIPAKRFERELVTFLTEQEADALLGACDGTTWTGRRDHTLLLLAIQSGLRISELAGLNCGDIVLTAGAHVHCLGKGRKERRTPLVRQTVHVLRMWLTERKGSPVEPLFPTITGQRLSRDAIEHRLAHYVAKAGQSCPSIGHKQVTAHTPQAHRRDATAAGRSRHHRHCLVARARTGLHHDHLPPRRYATERARHRSRPTASHQTRSLSSWRCPPGLPGGPVIMPTPSALLDLGSKLRSA